jgi:hypothetical protein
LTAPTREHQATTSDATPGLTRLNALDGELAVAAREQREITILRLRELDTG